MQVRGQLRVTDVLTKALAPRLFGLGLDEVGADALWVSVGIGKNAT